MSKVIQSVVLCIILACMYGAPAHTMSTQDVENSQHKMMFEELFVVESRTLTDDGIIIEVEALKGSSALTVFTDVTYGLLIYRYNGDDICYISSLAEYNDTRSAQENPSSMFKYRLEPISEINHHYFSYTATDSMKRICSGAKNILWSKIDAEDEKETRQKRSFCRMYDCYMCRMHRFYCKSYCRTYCRLIGK
ncbi:uncharacterized protein LOC117123319 isoform X2 [Anneissia japonica]|uniref:uncharacterized protein LOC117123319 isoform X2 n=1 Tax=Anneissia japonica TaxID=1529436 RepID=UPI001425B4AE|nr:uncharacterized protein LOC117123319 isoform X2 [Anneissia japonica]